MNEWKENEGVSDEKTVGEEKKEKEIGKAFMDPLFFKHVGACE